MSDAAEGPTRRGNRLLAALPPDEYARLAPHLETVALSFKLVLYAPDEPITHLYFPTEGVASLLQFNTDGTAVEAATVGNEGMVGLPVFLGLESTPGQAVVQIAGAGQRIPWNVFRREVQAGTPLHDLLHRYTQALMVQMAQGAACNRLHSITERCARWLAMTRDRVRGDEFALTQEFLAQMLGTRRAAVSEAASALQEAGLIRYTRGTIRVLDRAGLEEAACACYGIIRTQYERALG
jgi:CRP-like cAMP-binding protein